MAAATPRIFSDVPLLNARSHELQITDDVDLRSRRGYMYILRHTQGVTNSQILPWLVFGWTYQKLGTPSNYLELIASQSPPPVFSILGRLAAEFPRLSFILFLDHFKYFGGLSNSLCWY